MISEPARLASRSFSATYRALALAIPGVQHVSREDAQVYLHEEPHPLANFAIDLRVGPDTMSSLRELTEARQMYVYTLPDDTPNCTPELLERAGFHASTRLHMMVGSSPTAEEPAWEPGGEEAIEFMVAQFFSAQRPRFREFVRQSLLHAEGCVPLVLRNARGDVMAAAMLSENGGTVGLYNLCVDGRLRGRGLGRAMVDGFLARGRRLGRAVTLQCDVRLVEWYRRAGFEEVGIASAYLRAGGK